MTAAVARVARLLVVAVALLVAPLATTVAAAEDGGNRLDRLAAELRRSPLAVDPELDWAFDPAARRRMLAGLRDAPAPVVVAVLPLITQDESGGDPERAALGLQRRLGRDAIYVVVDQRGAIEVSNRGVRLALEIPFDLRYPPLDRRSPEARATDPGPAGTATVPSRLAAVVAAVRRAQPGPPGPGITSVSRLSSLPGTSSYDEDDGTPVVGLAVLGGLLGLAGGGIVVWRQRRRRARPRAADGAPATVPPVAARRGGSAKQRRRRGQRRKHGRR